MWRTRSRVSKTLDAFMLGPSLGPSLCTSIRQFFNFLFACITKVQYEKRRVDRHANQSGDHEGCVHDKIAMKYPEQVGREQENKGVKRKVIYFPRGIGLVELREQLNAVDDRGQGRDEAGYTEQRHILCL